MSENMFLQRHMREEENKSNEWAKSGYRDTMNKDFQCSYYLAAATMLI